MRPTSEAVATASATTSDSAEATDERQTTTTKTTTTHRLGPTDDAYVEIYRPNIPLGDRTKLKLDAIDIDDDEERDDGKDEDETRRNGGGGYDAHQGHFAQVRY